MRAGLLGIVVAALLVVACGSDKNDGGVLGNLKSQSGSQTSSPTSDASTSSNSTTFDVKKADALAHASLVKANELPGAGWRSGGPDDDFADETPTAKECNEYGSFRASAEKDAAGKAKRDLTKDVKNSDTGVEVTLTVVVYDTVSKASSYMAKYKPLIANNSITNCLRAAIKDEVGPSATVNIKNASALGSVPSGGVPLALDLDIPSEKASLHAEFYAWSVANSDVSISITAPKDALTPDVVNGILQKSNAAAQDAAAGKRS